MLALVTCSELPDGDSHDHLLAAALGGAPFVVWSDPAVDWAVYDRVVLRSPWDYTHRLDEFLAWVRSIGDRLVNPGPLVAWNTDKRYLAELAAAGLPVVPTTVLEPGDRLPPLLSEETVVKPTVSAGSRDTARFTPDEPRAAAELLATIHASGRTALVQPYVRSVDTRGETALIFFAGEFSHAIHKRALLGPGGEAVSTSTDPDAATVRAPTAAELTVSERVLAWVTDRFGAVPVYARVDLVEDDHGDPQLLELEVVEPSLFFALVPEAAERFAAVLTTTRT